MVEIKTPKEIEKIRKASNIVAEVLCGIKKKIKPGVSTAQLNEFAEDQIARRGGICAFLGYRGYPAALCVSINEEVVHGIPDKKRFIREGDVVSVDLGCVFENYYGDAALTVGAGKITAEHKKLIEAAEQALDRAISAVKKGARLGDVSHAIEKCAAAYGMSVIREFTGHGIGRKLHEEPSIPNFGSPGTGIVLESGMTLAIEPMLSLGRGDVSIKKDGWTAVTADGSCSAHFEHTLCVTDTGCEVLTAGI
ncbi:MAG: type I methionyl aminopeptidase [Elusimicrobia bacterium]|nr:type I methionyl aminopeptidase [Elusimicrobiota bacterium]